MIGDGRQDGERIMGLGCSVTGSYRTKVQRQVRARTQSS